MFPRVIFSCILGLATTEWYMVMGSDLLLWYVLQLTWAA
jgi:hypothetical protein